MKDQQDAVHVVAIPNKDNHEGRFESNMVICVESLIAEKGSESVKLETQVPVTANGVERLDTFPWEI